MHGWLNSHRIAREACMGPARLCPGQRSPSRRPAHVPTWANCCTQLISQATVGFWLPRCRASSKRSSEGHCSRSNLRPVMAGSDMHSGMAITSAWHGEEK